MLSLSALGQRNRKASRKLIFMLRSLPWGLWGGGAGPSGDLPPAVELRPLPSPERTGRRAGACRWGHLQPHTWRRLERTWLQLCEFSIVKPLSRSGKRFRVRAAGFRGLHFPHKVLAFGGARTAVHVLR